MKKRALRKNFYMEIRKSLGRFLSIFFIVAMGVAFFSGIRSAEPDMRYSADAYFDRNDFMDIQVMGTLGITEEDVTANPSADLRGRHRQKRDILQICWWMFTETRKFFMYLLF